MTVRIGFLFLGPASHVAHAASIAFELDAMDGYDVVAFVSGATNAGIIRDLAKARDHDLATEWLEAGPGYRLVHLFKKRAYPRIRHVLRHNLRRLHSLDALVMTDAHAIRWPGPHRPPLILAGHGAGIRADGRYPGMDQFELVLLPGQAKFERFRQMGILEASRARIIGYPKFDLTPPALQRRKLFANGNPTVVYNPHFNKRHSSWTAWGRHVLDYFLAHPEFNLIFAPHLLLFGKRTRRARLPARYSNASNIVIDLDSTALIDMTYTAAADIYLGDVSSQAYEFVGSGPRPCIFLDPHGRPWKSDDNLKMWQMGDVVGDIAALDDALRHARTRFASYRPVQERLVAAAFERGDLPSGRRGANAIAEFLSR